MGFIPDQRRQQIEFRRISASFSQAAKANGFVGNHQYDFVIPREQRYENLEPCIREQAIDYFSQNKIEWHRMCHHLLSSQICCVNFLMPFGRSPGALAQLLAPLYGDIEVMPIEGDDVFVAFEWIGGDYIGESRNGRRTRGANCTSADAAVKFRKDRQTHIVLIEWKYTEFYGRPPAASAETTRLQRYGDKVFFPKGPLKSAIGWTIPDLFYEPIYQLLRQQMLAFQCMLHRCCDRASVLHIAPKDNIALRKVTSSKLTNMGEDVFKLWPTLLTDRNSFESVSTGQLFAPMVGKPPESFRDWASYIGARYGSILN
jgi:hypothetical protein